MAVVVSSTVGEVGAGTCCYVREAHSVCHQAETSSLRTLPSTVHRTWEWELQRAERTLTVRTKAEVPIYRLVRGLDGDPKSDARQENPQRFSSFRY